MAKLEVIDVAKFTTDQLTKKFNKLESNFRYHNGGGEGRYIEANGCQIEHFMKTGESLLRAGKQSLFLWEEWCSFDPKTGIVFAPITDSGADLAKIGKRAVKIMEKPIDKRFSKSFVPPAVLIPSKKKNQQYLGIFNGDDNVDYPPGLPLENSLTVSFECLRRFYDNISAVDVAKRLQTKLKVVDYIGDKRISLSTKEQEVLSKWRKGRKTGDPPTLSPPEPGFTRIAHAWHCSATALFYDTEKDFSILIGQDGNMYFGVELKDNPKSVKAAFKSLTPPEALVKGVARQGEWFVVPVDEPPSV